MRRPTRLPGHGPSQSEWRQRRDMVPAEPIINLLEGFKQEHNLTWKQVSDIVGIYYPASRLRRHRFLAKTRAEQMLRAMRSYRLQQS
ncbi:hypothetical protein KY386_02465 [Candidatus Parcubacteria bacterium]|nr:hypothetical protein [Candidatus Parcubacteria bacterium]